MEEVGVVVKTVKRQAGCCILWNGAYTNAFLANQIIPPDKVLRAVGVLNDVVNEAPVAFSVYRSVMGLVVHLRQLMRRRRVNTDYMFRPFLRGLKHPAANIITSRLLRNRAAELVKVLMEVAGASCADPPTESFEAAPTSWLTSAGLSLASWTPPSEGPPFPVWEAGSTVSTSLSLFQLTSSVTPSYNWSFSALSWVTSSSAPSLARPEECL
jgi:hypothetical protein